MTKLLIATPAYGQIFYSPYVESVIKLTQLIHRNHWGFAFRSISYAEISESRNYLLTHWIDKTDASHVLFIDADMGFEPQLIAEMIAFDKPVVGVAYPKRKIDLHRVTALAAAGEPSDRAITKAYEFVLRPLRRGPNPKVVNGFMEVEGCGAGILLIQRSCVETMLRRIPGLSDEKAKKTSPITKDLDRLIRAFDILNVGGHRLSEDYSFCHRWRNLCQGEVWVSVGHAITHIGLQEFKSRYADGLAVGPQDSVAPGQSMAGQLRAKADPIAKK